MTKIYLCARVAYDARALNLEVATTLRACGYDVYLPQEQAPNNLSQSDMDEGRYDTATIFKLDFAALDRAALIVAVGRMGADCAWELGYAARKSIPVVHVPGTDTTWQRSPMLIPTLRRFPEATCDTVDTVVNAILKRQRYA